MYFRLAHFNERRARWREGIFHQVYPDLPGTETQMKEGRRRQSCAEHHIDLCERDLGAHELRESLSSVLSAEHQVVA